MRMSKHYMYVSRLMREIEMAYVRSADKGNCLGTLKLEGMTVIMPIRNPDNPRKEEEPRAIPAEHRNAVYAENIILWRLDLSGLEYDKIKAKYILDCDLTGIKGKIPLKDFKNQTLRVAYCRLPRVNFMDVDTTECFLRGSDLSMCAIFAGQIFSSIGMDAGEDDMPENLTKFPRIRIQKKDIPYGRLDSLAGLDLTKLYSLDVGLFANIPCYNLKLPSRLTFNEVNFNAQPYLHFSMKFINPGPFVDLSRVEFPYNLLLFCSRLEHVEIKARFPKNLSIFPREMLPQNYEYIGVNMSQVENFPSDLIFAGEYNKFHYTDFPAGTDFSKAKLRQFEECSCMGPCIFSEENFKDLYGLCRVVFSSAGEIDMTKESADALSTETLAKIAKTEMQVEGMNIFHYITLRAKDNSPIGAKMKQIALRCL